MRLPVALVCALFMPAGARAQTAATAEPPTASAEQYEQEHHPRPPTRLYLGMWTAHLKNDVIALDNNWAVGLSWRGFFGATFLNSYGRRAYTGGIQRTIVSTDPRPIGASLGFRLGFVTGYDGRLMRLARETPVLPLVQPYASIDVQHVSFEVSYTFVVVSLAMSYRF